MRVTVYAISKNEEKFAARWVKSMAEADHICVLDTGSTDDGRRSTPGGSIRPATGPWS